MPSLDIRFIYRDYTAFITMRWWNTLILAACAGRTAAHADPNDPSHSLPKLAGARRFLSEFKGGRRWDSQARAMRRAEMLEARGEEELEERGELEPRQRSGRCGAGRGSCAASQCCSAEGLVHFCHLPIMC